jgi:hypothetical protein
MGQEGPGMAATRITQIVHKAPSLQAAGGAHGEDTLRTAGPAFALGAEAALAPQNRLPHHQPVSSAWATGWA